MLGNNGYFLTKNDVFHLHQENIPKELVEAFRGMDPGRKGVIRAKDLWHILVKWGEKLSPREGKNLILILLDTMYSIILLRYSI